MKFREFKRITKIMKDAGWKWTKWGFEKRWEKGELRVSTMLGDWEVFHTRCDLEEMISYYERTAVRRLERATKSRPVR